MKKLQEIVHEMEELETQTLECKPRSKTNGRYKELESQYEKLESMVLESSQRLKRRVESIENIYREHEGAKENFPGQIYDSW